MGIFDSVIRKVRLLDSSNTEVANDDAAAAGPIFPAAGVYQSSASEVDAGDIGRLRMSARRGLIAMPDFQHVVANASSVSSAGDLMVSSDGSTYISPTTAFFNGADAGFGAAARYVAIPMQHWQECTVTIFNSLAVNITLAAYAVLDSVISGGAVGLLYTESGLGSGGFYTLSPHDDGTGGTIKFVAALRAPMKWLRLALTPASDPSSGSFYIFVARR